MTGRILLGGRRSGRNFAALLAVSCIPSARMVIEAMKQADEKAARASILNGQVSGLEAGQNIQFGGEVYRVTMCGPAIDQAMIEKIIRPAMLVEPRGAPKFGGDRPYLKRKKGRS